MSRPKIIYIAGPMSGFPEFNRYSFSAAMMGLQKQYKSAVVINPSCNFGDRKDLDWSVYMRHSMHQLLMTDMIYMLDGWKTSKGASLEHRIAEALELKIVYQKVVRES